MPATLHQGQVIEYVGKRYQVDKVDVNYGGRRMVSAFRWIKSKAKFSSVAYIIGTTEDVSADNCE